MMNDLLDNLCNIIRNIGSLKEWCYFTGFSTALMINCYKERNSYIDSYIASVVSDNHGRISIDLIYNNFVDYFNGKNKINEKERIIYSTSNVAPILNKVTNNASAPPIYLEDSL